MRKQIEALAARGVPTVSLLLEPADCEIAWPMQNLQVNVFNTGTPAVGFAEALDMLACVHMASRGSNDRRARPRNRR